MQITRELTITIDVNNEQNNATFNIFVTINKLFIFT